MARPTVSPFTERVYEQLPSVYIDNDSSVDYPLLRYLSLLCDQAGEIADIYDRLNYDDTNPTGTSDLSDPATADEAWLPWLAQMVGADTFGLSGQAVRDAIAGAVSGFRSGTKTAIADAARSALTGTRYVKVYDHSVANVGDGGQWDVLLVTRTSETADVPAVLAAVTAKNAKPAGVQLHHRAYSATYTEVQAATSPDTYSGRQSTFATYQAASDFLP